MLHISFNSIAEMLDYNQALLSTLEALYEYEADKWNSREEPHDTLCDPQYHNVHFNTELDSFIIPCWLSCDTTYDDSGWADNDPYIPYTVEIPLEQVVEYMKENYGYG